VHSPTTPVQTNLVLSGVCMGSTGSSGSGSSGSGTSTNTSTGTGSSTGISGTPVGGYGNSINIQPIKTIILFMICFSISLIILE